MEHFEYHARFGAQQVAYRSSGRRPARCDHRGRRDGVGPGNGRRGSRAGLRGVFVAYNNPTAILWERIARSRAVIDDPGCTKLDLFTGPMALSGSTRMQATTIAMLVIGQAMAEALLEGAGERWGEHGGPPCRCRSVRGVDRGPVQSRQRCRPRRLGGNGGGGPCGSRDRHLPDLALSAGRVQRHQRAQSHLRAAAASAPRRQRAAGALGHGSGPRAIQPRRLSGWRSVGAQDPFRGRAGRRGCVRSAVRPGLPTGSPAAPPIAVGPAENTVSLHEFEGQRPVLARLHDACGRSI